MSNKIIVNVFDEAPVQGWMQELANATANAAVELAAPTLSTATVDVTFTTDADIQELNREHRGIDQPTDVLSFPLLDYAAPGQPTIQPGCIHPEHGALLGDIVISLPRMEAQALEYGHGQERELGFLVLHGMLHLLGYDHETPAQEQCMTDMQDKVLDCLDLRRY